MACTSSFEPSSSTHDMSGKLVPQVHNGEMSTTSRSLPRRLLKYLSLYANRRKQSDTSTLARYSEEKIIQPSLTSVRRKRNDHDDVRPTVEAKPYNWPHDLSFHRTTTALVLIDMQKDFCSPDGYLVYQGYDISPVRNIIPCLMRLLDVFRANSFPIYYTREGHRGDLSTLSGREHLRSRNNSSGLGIGDMGPLGRLLIRGEAGHDIIPELYPRPDEPIIDKPGRSAFQHTEFKLMLNIRGVRNLVFCGVTTDVCVHSTMREANDNGFDCLLVEDATAASHESLHSSAVESVKSEGGIFGAVASTQKILHAFRKE